LISEEIFEMRKRILTIGMPKHQKLNKKKYIYKLFVGYRVFPGGIERPGRDADPSPPSSAVGHERVELYLYSTYGPFGLYRASVPVQG
jgi:hypothetical protein